MTPRTTSAFLGPAFRVERLQLADALIHAEVGGSGPPLLLLHGYPQTHAAWHRVAPELARHFTVVAPDLRGYGDSIGPQPGDDPDADAPRHYGKRVMAGDMLALMHALGFDRFSVLGHDRGGRVGYRLCMDHPRAAACFCSLTVIPTEEMWKRADMAFGMNAWHWFLFAQPDDLPERLLRADPDHFLDRTLRHMVERADSVAPAALAEYRRAFRRESVRHAMMQDYRAGAGIDLAHDREDLAAGRRLACPVQVLWSASRSASPTPLEIWRGWATQVEGASIDCGHLMAEEAPDEVLARVLPFLQRHGAAA